MHKGGIIHMYLLTTAHIKVYKLIIKTNVYLGPENGAEQSVPSVLLHEYFS